MTKQVVKWWPQLERKLEICSAIPSVTNVASQSPVVHRSRHRGSDKVLISLWHDRLT